jgi:hypothetical protein
MAGVLYWRGTPREENSMTANLPGMWGMGKQVKKASGPNRRHYTSHRPSTRMQMMMIIITKAFNGGRL